MGANIDSGCDSCLNCSIHGGRPLQDLLTVAQDVYHDPIPNPVTQGLGHMRRALSLVRSVSGEISKISMSLSSDPIPVWAEILPERLCGLWAHAPQAMKIMSEFRVQIYDKSTFNWCPGLE